MSAPTTQDMHAAGAAALADLRQQIAVTMYGGDHASHPGCTIDAVMPLIEQYAVTAVRRMMAEAAAVADSKGNLPAAALLRSLLGGVVAAPQHGTGTYFDTVRSMSRDPAVLAAVDKAEAEWADR